jgi:hypothetical protein
MMAAVTLWESSMRTIYRTIYLTTTAVAALAALSMPAHSSAATTHCTAQEQVVFSCSMAKSAKIVSLCASKPLTKNVGYLQYRFGTPQKMELEFPATKTDTQRQFKYSYYFRASVNRFHIMFDNAGVAYDVYSEYDGEERPAIARYGVEVTPKGKRAVQLACGKGHIGHFSDLPDALACGEDNEVLCSK